MSKKASKNQRELKVYTKYASSKYGKASILPEIRLKGNWLRNSGFECGAEINVLCDESWLVIRNRQNKIPTVRL